MLLKTDRTLDIVNDQNAVELKLHSMIRIFLYAYKGFIKKTFRKKH